MAETAHVVGDVLHPDLRFGACQADCAHQRASHVVGLCAEDMFYTDPNGGFRPVASLGLFGQQLTPFALAVDVALEFAVPQLDLHFLRSIRRIRPHARTGVTAHQQMIHRLTVVQGSVADVIAPNQLVLAVHVYVVFVAVVALAVFLGPARIRIFL